MSIAGDVIEYEFKKPLEENSYCIFPLELEQDSTIFFHGTRWGNFDSIYRFGFKPKPPLDSISFNEISSHCINFASGHGEDGVVIAVKFSCPEILLRESSNQIAYLYELAQQPKIIGYCLIPASYRFV